MSFLARTPSNSSIRRPDVRSTDLMPLIDLLKRNENTEAISTMISTLIANSNALQDPDRTAADRFRHLQRLWRLTSDSITWEQLATAADFLPNAMSLDERNAHSVLLHTMGAAVRNTENEHRDLDLSDQWTDSGWVHERLKEICEPSQAWPRERRLALSREISRRAMILITKRWHGEDRDDEEAEGMVGGW